MRLHGPFATQGVDYIDLYYLHRKASWCGRNNGCLPAAVLTCTLPVRAPSLPCA